MSFRPRPFPPNRRLHCWRWWVFAGLALAGVMMAGCNYYVKLIHGGPAEKGEELEISPCAPGKYGGTFVLLDLNEPKTFNPLVPADLYSQMAQGYVLDSLVHYSQFTGDGYPALAKSWEIGADKKTYTFHLRQGLKWSDGAPFNADDVIFTFDCIFTQVTDPATGKMKLKYPSRPAEEFTFDGKPLQYRKIDDFTVEFYTPEIFSTFIMSLPDIVLLPKHKLEKAFEDGSLQQMWTSETAINHPEEIVGMGAFTVYKLEPGERIVYAANPHYWRADALGQRLPYTDFFVDQFVASMDNALLLFSTGKADFFNTIPATEVSWMSRNAKLYDYTVYNCGVSPGSYFYWFNQKPGVNKEGKPYLEPYKFAWFSNVKFRQALMYGFNREGVCKAVYFGRAEPEESIINQGNPTWYNPNVVHYTYDPAKARGLLKDAGFHWDEHGQLFDAQGHAVEIELVYSNRLQQYDDMAAVFKSNMKDLGITVRVTPLDWGALLENVVSTFHYEMAMIGWGSSGGAVDPSGNKGFFLSSSEDHLFNPSETTPATAWEKRIDDLVSVQEQTFDHAERKQAFDEIQQIYSEQLPVYYLVAPDVFQGIQNRVQNVRIPPTGYFNWNQDEYWLAKTPADRKPPVNEPGFKTE